MANRFSKGFWRVCCGLVVVAVIGASGACGSAASKGSSAQTLERGHVAPIEGSPEQTAIELGRATLESASYRVAPVEGSPEATAIELALRAEKQAQRVDVKA